MSTQSNFSAVLDVRWECVGPKKETVSGFEKDQLEENILSEVSPLVAQGVRSGKMKVGSLLPGSDAEKKFVAHWQYRSIDFPQEINLPYGVKITRHDEGGASLTSELAKQFSDEDGFVDVEGEAAADAIESFLLALANKGADLSSQQFADALEDAVDSIGQNMF